MLYPNYSHPKTLDWFAEYSVENIPFCEECEIFYDVDDECCPLCKEFDGYEAD